VDWVAEREYRRPRALNAPNDEAYYQELKEMVLTLNDAHSRFMTPAEADEHFALTRNEITYGGLGFYTMPLPDGALILQVMPNSPAERAGVRACDRITAFNGGGYWTDSGALGTTATVDLFRPGVGSYQLTLTREEVNQVIGVPGQLLDFNGQRIGYVRIDTLWIWDVPPLLRQRLAEFEAGGPLDGLILDLRSNIGGWRPVLQGILGTFVSGELGDFYGRLESDILYAPDEDDPPPSHPDLPLVVLVSQRTESYAEVLAATLQAERGAIVIGQPTQGNVETIFPRRLPFGARVWIAEQGFRLNNGETLEGTGVQPDVLDNTDWTRYACGQDPQVEQAAILLTNR
jgi:C-terminal processing protease CtpA/Prc